MWPFGDSNKKQLREIEKQIAENQMAYRRVFESPSGQAVLRDLKKRCCVNTTTYHSEPGQWGMNEGRRSIYMYITNLLEKDIKQIIEDLTGE